MTALDSALQFLQTAVPEPASRELQICTYSQSALGLPKKGPAAQNDALTERQGVAAAARTR